MYQYYINRQYMYNKYQAELQGLSAPVKEAFIFQKYLETIPVHIKQDDYFAGWYGYADTYPQEIQAFFDGLHREWAEYEKQAAAKPDEGYILAKTYITRASGYDLGHHSLDYKCLLTRGLDAFLDDIEQELAITPEYTDKYEYLKAMRISLKASEILGKRYAELALSLAHETTSPQEKARLQRIADICRKVPMHPPEDFFEAVQAAYLIWSLNCISDTSWCSISFGSFDQFMYPYYLRSKEKGSTDEEMELLLLQLFRLLDYYGGQDCVISVGGMDIDERDLTNDLSRLIVQTEKKSLLRGPLLAARINQHTPQDFLLSLIDRRLFEMGQPTFYSEEMCKKAMISRGIDAKIAAGYSINSCMGMVIPGAEASDMWGIILNMHLPLELALNGGKPLKGELPIPLRTQPCYEYRSLEEVYLQYSCYLRELFLHMKNLNLHNTFEGARNNPNPWMSALTLDCIKTGCDCRGGGARYHSVTVEAMAFGITGDALTVIDELVFKQKAYTIPQLLKAAQDNYAGNDELHMAIMRCAKYGMNNVEADENSRRVLSILADICEDNRKLPLQFLPSLHTLNADVEFGRLYYATLDGRFSGEPINKNAGPTNTTRGYGPTSVAMSAARLDQYRLSGGQALDMHFGIKNIDVPEKKAKLAALIRTYLSLGGLELQVNALSAQSLQMAYENPNEYKNLIVRIGGHSRYFNELSDEVKLEFINRFKIEESW